MQVKFTIDYDLIELVDAIGLDYEIVDAESDLIDDYKEIEITIDDVEWHLESILPIESNVSIDEFFTDEKLCDYLLNPTLSEALIKTERIYD